MALTRRIKADFAYEPGATEVGTSVAEAFQKRHGVCQDFAHVMIAGLRGNGIPAAYVSGFLRTLPPPGKPRLQGADAMHAWVTVWLGRETGWVGFDPTNAVLAGTDHIVLAIGPRLQRRVAGRRRPYHDRLAKDAALGRRRSRRPRTRRPAALGHGGSRNPRGSLGQPVGVDGVSARITPSALSVGLPGLRPRGPG